MEMGTWIKKLISSQDTEYFQTTESSSYYQLYAI